MRINCNTSVETLAYDAPIKMEISKTMKAMPLLFVFLSLFTGFTSMQLQFYYFNFEVHNETIKFNSCSYIGVKTGRWAKWKTEEGCCNLHVLTGY